MHMLLWSDGQFVDLEPNDNFLLTGDSTKIEVPIDVNSKMEFPYEEYMECFRQSEQAYNQVYNQAVELSIRTFAHSKRLTIYDMQGKYEICQIGTDAKFRRCWFIRNINNHNDRSAVFAFR